MIVGLRKTHSDRSDLVKDKVRSLPLRSTYGQPLIRAVNDYALF